MSNHSFGLKTVLSESNLVTADFQTVSGAPVWAPSAPPDNLLLRAITKSCCVKTSEPGWFAGFCSDNDH